MSKQGLGNYREREKERETERDSRRPSLFIQC